MVDENVIVWFGEEKNCWGGGGSGSSFIVGYGEKNG